MKHIDTTPFFTRLRSYGRVKTHALSPRQSELVDAYASQFSVPSEEFRMDWIGSKEQAYSAIKLEIGFGGGEHLVARAAHEPDVFWIGAEPFINGWVKALNEIVEANLSNVAIHNDDVRELLETLPSQILDQVCILYPDPWTKRKHNKRRIINDELIKLLSRVLKTGAIIQVATDIEDYALWIMEHFERSDLFEKINPSLYAHTHSFEGWPGTRYEEKAHKAGRTCFYFTFTRK